MADTIDHASDYSGSESEFGPNGSAVSTNNDGDTDNNSELESGALSPATAACIEELTHELSNMRKSKGKKRPRPSGLHLFSGLQAEYFCLLIFVRPSESSGDNRINFPSYPTPSRFSRSGGTRAIGNPLSCYQPTISCQLVGHGTAGKAQESCPRL